jgi:hypothetical protein
MRYEAHRPVAPSRRKTDANAGLFAAALGLGVAAGYALSPRVPARRRPAAASNVRQDRGGRIDPPAEARRLNRASTLLGLSVLADSGLEHYRGDFFNKAMVTPLVASTLLIGSNLHAIGDRGSASRRVRHVAQALSGLAGTAGFGFHAYNVTKREGGLSWLNLFYGAPIGAPFALTLAGLLGFLSESVRGADRHDPRLFGLPAGKTLAGVTAVGLLGTAGEAGLLHFRGAYHNPFMYAPVTIPPLTAALVAATIVSSDTASPGLTRAMLRVTAGLGFAGAGLHAFGVSRNMGGWRNWSQNILNGPPIPAPPSFTGLALAGLVAIDLMEAHRHG